MLPLRPPPRLPRDAPARGFADRRLPLLPGGDRGEVVLGSLSAVVGMARRSVCGVRHGAPQWQQARAYSILFLRRHRKHSDASSRGGRREGGSGSDWVAPRLVSLRALRDSETADTATCGGLWLVCCPLVLRMVAEVHTFLALFLDVLCVAGKHFGTHAHI